MLPLSKCFQRIQILKNEIKISFSKELYKIRNSSNSSIRQNRCSFILRKPKTITLFASLALVPPFVPIIYAKELIEPIDPKIKQIDDKELNNELDEINEVEVINDSVNLINHDQSPNFTWKELWSLIRPSYGYFIISILGSFAIAYLNIKIPICLGDLTNQISNYVNTEFDPKEFFSSIKQPALNLIWCYVLQGAFTSLTITSLSCLGENFALNLRLRLFKSIINQDIEFFDRNRGGSILSVLTNDVQEFKSSFKTFFAQGLRSITQTIGCAISLFIISPKLTSFLCILVPNIVLVGSLIGYLLRDISLKCQLQSAKLSSISNEIISSIRTIKASAAEEKEIELYNNEINKLSQLNQKLGVGIACFQGLTNIALNGIVLSCMLAGGHLMSNSEITPGDLMSFLVASQTIQRSLASLSLMTGHYIKYINTGNRIFEFINLKSNLPSSTSDQRLDPLFGEISFRKVNFSYPTRKQHQIFENLNLRINPGQVLGLVGMSGSGKSTIAMLLERFYDVDSGSINIDGLNIKNLDIKWLRTQIGYINQEPTLFSTSIIENIRYGNPNATDEEVYKAAKLANAHNFIKSFPDSYQTVVGDRGLSLSGGQRQRIAIAREILKNPKILILDESTSALDAKSEKLITDALEKLMKGRTVLIIAHRLNTIRENCDLIAVISNGKICELGTHDELVRREGLYWQLIKQQSN